MTAEDLTIRVPIEKGCPRCGQQRIQDTITEAGKAAEILKPWMAKLENEIKIKSTEVWYLELRESRLVDDHRELTYRYSVEEALPKSRNLVRCK